MDDNLIATPEGKVVVYIVRPSYKLKKYASYIFCDDSFIDMISPGQFRYLILDPGDHIFQSVLGGSRHTLHLSIEPGLIYFLEVKVQGKQDVLYGLLYFSNRLIHINDSDGRVYLSKCKLPKEKENKKEKEIKEKEVKQYNNLNTSPIAPPEGKAELYIIRKKGKDIEGSSIILCDGKYINTIHPKQFYKIILDPGDHIFYSEITGAGSTWLSKLSLNVKAGMSYFIEEIVAAQLGGMPGLISVTNTLVNITNSNRVAYVNKCKLAPTVPIEYLYPTTSKEIKEYDRMLKRINK